MNPHLQYAQAIPVGAPDAASALLNGTFCRPRGCSGPAPGIFRVTETDQEALQTWFRTYLTWLRESKYGKEESKQYNNHSTYYDRR